MASFHGCHDRLVRRSSSEHGRSAGAPQPRGGALATIERGRRARLLHLQVEDENNYADDDDDYHDDAPPNEESDSAVSNSDTAPTALRGLALIDSQDWQDDDIFVVEVISDNEEVIVISSDELSSPSSDEEVIPPTPPSNNKYKRQKLCRMALRASHILLSLCFKCPLLLLCFNILMCMYMINFYVN